jgi:hypothetical protein
VWQLIPQTFEQVTQPFRRHPVLWGTRPTRTSVKTANPKIETMKTTTLLLASLFGTAALAFSQAPEQERPERPERPQRGAQRQISPELLKEFDADGNGELSADERTKMREVMAARAEERRKEALEKYDENKNGELDAPELAKLRADLEKEFDKDGDGTLSPEERRAMMQSGRLIGGGRPGARGGEGGARPPRGEGGARPPRGEGRQRGEGGRQRGEGRRGGPQAPAEAPAGE